MIKVTALNEISVPLAGNVSNALVNFSTHTVSLIAVTSDVHRHGKPVTGVAFNSIGRFAQGGLLRERFFPRLLGSEPRALLTDDERLFDPARVTEVLLRNEKPGGHGDRAAAVGGLELAFWDLNAKLLEEPAWQTISRYFDSPVREASIPVYAAGGYYHEGKGTAGLKDEIRSYQDSGYLDFKIKIGGASLAEDMNRLEAVLEIAGDGCHVAVDANGRFDLHTAVEYAEAMNPLGLRWFEEAGDPLDYELNRQLAGHYPGALATGENLFSVIEVRNLARYGGLRADRDILQMDPGLCYGLTTWFQMLRTLEQQGFTRASFFPHGGHLINLHIATALGLGGCESYPGVFQPFGGYPDHCLTRDGHATPGNVPGFGLEEKPGLKAVIDSLAG